jgi:hypothetical protein
MFEEMDRVQAALMSKDIHRVTEALDSTSPYILNKILNNANELDKMFLNNNLEIIQLLLASGVRVTTSILDSLAMPGHGRANKAKLSYLLFFFRGIQLSYNSVVSNLENILKINHNILRANQNVPALRDNKQQFEEQLVELVLRPHNLSIEKVAKLKIQLDAPNIREVIPGNLITEPPTDTDTIIASANENATQHLISSACGKRQEIISELTSTIDNIMGTNFPRDLSALIASFSTYAITTSSRRAPIDHTIEKRTQYIITTISTISHKQFSNELHEAVKKYAHQILFNQTITELEDQSRCCIL